MITKKIKLTVTMFLALCFESAMATQSPLCQRFVYENAQIFFLGERYASILSDNNPLSLVFDGEYGFVYVCGKQNGEPACQASNGEIDVEQAIHVQLPTRTSDNRLTKSQMFHLLKGSDGKDVILDVRGPNHGWHVGSMSETLRCP